jgi:hypothetical protein
VSLQLPSQFNRAELEKALLQQCGRTDQVLREFAELGVDLWECLLQSKLPKTPANESQALPFERH